MINYENLYYLKTLCETFSPRCGVRTLDRGLDADDHYRYLLKRSERFVIRAKKNRNVIYHGRTRNIVEVTDQYKGSYCMKF